MARFARIVASSAIAGFAIALILSACGRGGREPKASVATESTTVVGENPEGTLYYGPTPSGDGFVLYLNFPQGKGVRYEPLENVNVCDLRRDAKGNVTWSSPNVQGYVTRFAGTLTTSGLRGEVTAANVKTGQLSRSFEVILESMPFPSASADTAAERYANVSYVQQAGDLTGIELLLLPTGKDTFALLTMFEGTQSGPWIMSNLRSNGDTIQGSYGTPPPFTIALVRSGNALTDRWGTVLERKVGLREILFAKSLAPCPEARSSQ